MAKGRRPLPWIKLWFDMLNDVKMNRLSIAERGCWVSLLLLAGQSPERGKLMLTEAEPMTMDDIAGALHLSPDEMTTLESCISKLTALGSLRWNDRCLEVINFKKRQEVYESDFQDYHKEVNKLRINSELSPGKVLKDVEVDVEEDVDVDVEKEKEKDVEKAKEKAPKGARKKRAAPTVSEIFSEMRRFLGYPENKVCGGEALPAIEENQAMTADRRDPIPNYGKEGQAIKRMLARGFTREEILDCWKAKVSQRGGEFVSMTWVNEDIGRKGAKGEQAKGARVKGARPAADFRGRTW